MPKEYKAETFEGIGDKFVDTHRTFVLDTSANIFESMLRSPAYMGLTDRQRCLYVICKAQLFGKPKPSEEYSGKFDEQCFFLDWETMQHYGLYKQHSHFYRDMKALIGAGFIERVFSGARIHEKSVYRYSSEWRKSWSKKHE